MRLTDCFADQNTVLCFHARCMYVKIIRITVNNKNTQPFWNSNEKRNWQNSVKTEGILAEEQ